MIGNGTTAALRALRAQSRSLMTDTCKIERPVSVWDEAQQKTVTVWTPIHVGVPCTLDEPPVRTRAMVTAETVTPGLPVVKIPVTYAGIKSNDRVTITAVGPQSDPEMVGTVMWVTHNRTRTTSVQHRLECRWIK